MAVIKAKLSGDIPVRMVFNDGHIRIFDWATEMVKLQLQTRCFLFIWEVRNSHSRCLLLSTKHVCVNDSLMKWDKRLVYLIQAA